MLLQDTAQLNVYMCVCVRARIFFFFLFLTTGGGYELVIYCF